MRISDWSSDVCSSDLLEILRYHHKAAQAARDDPFRDLAPVMSAGDVQIAGAGEGGGQRLRRSGPGFLHDADAHRTHVQRPRIGHTEPQPARQGDGHPHNGRITNRPRPSLWSHRTTPVWVN